MTLSLSASSTASNSGAIDMSATISTSLLGDMSADGHKRFGLKQLAAIGVGTCDQLWSLCVAGYSQLGDIRLRAFYHAVGYRTGPELQSVELFYQRYCEKLDALTRPQPWLVEPAGRA